MRPIHNQNHSGIFVLLALRPGTREDAIQS
jgi:hypothetical protein